MTEDQFWNLIETSRAETENADEQADDLEKRLAKLSEAEILSFADIFTAHYNRLYTWDHLGRRFCDSRGMFG